MVCVVKMTSLLRINDVLLVLVNLHSNCLTKSHAMSEDYSIKP